MRQPETLITSNSSLSDAYESLRPLSLSNAIHLCRERATGRLLAVKSYSAKHFFQAEARALHHLRGFAGAPNLYFALETSRGGLIGSEFLPGISWREAVKQIPAQPLALALHRLVQELHRDYGITHGDLSAKNILVNGENPQAPRIYLVDWEFSRDLRGENVASHAHFRGSLGYCEIGEEHSLRKKDEVALDECLEEIPGGKSVVEAKRRNLRWWSWT